MAAPFQLPRGEGERVLLSFEYGRRYRAPALRVADVGNLRMMPGESIATFGSRIRWLTGLVLERGAVPVLLGGDHSVTSFALEALAAGTEDFGIIHFDAHHDLYPPLAANFSYVTHANPFTGVLESPRLKRLFQLGLRMSEHVEAGKLRADPRVSYVSARELQRRSPEQVFAGLDRTLPYYLSFDVDCLDPSIAPETGTPEPGGLTYYQALDLVDHASREFRLLGWDIVEVGQREGLENRAACVAARLLEQLLLGRMAFEPLGPYLRNP